MKRLVPLIVLLLHSAMAMAQTIYGNEWIDFDRRYWKFEVAIDGVYRIDSAALAQSGFPIGQVDPRHLMLFGKEKQVPIYVQGEQDGVFNTGDFIEFQAEHADGTVDKRMYPHPEADPHPNYSLYNDTLRYYLTWDPMGPVQRIKNYVNTAFAGHVPRNWVFTEALRILTDSYFVGQINTELGAIGIAGTLGTMLESEGFGGEPMFSTAAPGQFRDVYVATPGGYFGADSPPATITAVVAAQNNVGGSSLFDHHLVLRHGPGFSMTGLDTIFNGSRVMRKPFSTPAYTIGDFTWVRYEVPHDLDTFGQVGFGTPDYLDWQVVSSLGVKYARMLSIGSAGPLSMGVSSDGTGAPLARLDITAFIGTPMIYAYGDTVRRVMPTFSGTAWQALIPLMPAALETRTYLHAQEGIRSVPRLRPVNSTGYFTDYGAMDVDSAMLIVAHSTLMNGALQYKNYRENESPTNRYNTVVVDVDELYDQFGGGVPKHAGGIRQFSKFLFDTWSTRPRALFLLGKSVNTWPAFYAGQPSIRPDVDGAYARCLVPSYGYPSCDQCFTTGINFDGRRMEVPVGRLSANTNADVINYLAKVRATEAQAPALWQKNILHFAGGFGSGQQGLLASLLTGFGNIVQDTCFGANVVLFRKNSSDVIQLASADSVRHYIEDEGVTLMTFFAHAFSTSFDITIDDPENYDWHGKHPMVIGNSCFIGDIHQNNSASSSEMWVMAPGVGPIAFMASIQQGLIGYLAQYTSEFYRSFGSVNYGASIGEHMKYATFQSQVNSPTVPTGWTAHTFTLEGDPTLVLNTHPKPDYSVTASEIFFEPAVVTADVDTFTVKVVVSNLGKAVNATFNVELQRTNPGLGTASINYFTTLSNVIIRDTAVFRVPTRGFSGGQGINQLAVRVDKEPDQVDELENDTNNITWTTLFIISGDLVPAYPYDFAIVPDPIVTLKASTGDPLAPPRNYVFQIDTTDLFNSPVRESTTIMAPGGVVEWTPGAIYALNTFEDSTVFYWRCSIDSTGNQGYNWYERSFQCIAGKNGWGQAHYFQFKNDHYSGIVYDRPDREFEFFEGERNMRANVLGNVGGPATEWYLELEAQDYGGCGPAAWHVAVVDPSTFESWKTYWVDDTGQIFNADHQFGNIGCRPRTEAYFSFHTNLPNELAGMQDMVTNQVPDGHHMLFYTWLYLDKDGMAANAPGLMPALQALGAPNFSTLQDSVPYIFYVQKGDPSSFRDTIGVTISQHVSLSVWVSTAYAQGVITTMNAGPATAWHGLYWNELPSDGLDSTRVKVMGIPASGGDAVQLLDLTSPLDSLPNLGSMINAQQYPRLRIQGQFFDANPVDTKPSQLERWQLLSSPVPECAIHPPLAYYNDLSGWAEGQQAAVAVAVQNISAFDMDSLLMAAWVVDATNVRHLVHYRINEPLPAGAWLVDTVRFSTLDFGGSNALIIEANPVDTATGVYDQLEQYHFNNIAQWRFDVDIDRENPVLDVTFDGIHIMDMDIVSARPEIMVSLDDENTMRLLDSPGDTASFKVFLVRPGQNITERIFFRNGVGDEVLQFVPASGPENIATIHYRPYFPTDGKYRLIVQASDLSHNASGDNDYKVNFEVINRSTITDVLNYPNPFTTSTRFVFTVTGSEPPSYMKVQIMTVTGKVVREVKMSELGPIRVGRNITEYAWDGTDEFGDRLARGVYLYRVIARLNGEDIETRETKASEYFTKGFGKMYLLR